MHRHLVFGGVYIRFDALVILELVRDPFLSVAIEAFQRFDRQVHVFLRMSRRGKKRNEEEKEQRQEGYPALYPAFISPVGKRWGHND